MSKVVRRVVTGHRNGRAVIARDDHIVLHDLASGDGSLGALWWTHTLPADNQPSPDEPSEQLPPVLGRGSALWIVELAPGGASPAHRTNSIDYGIVLSGELSVTLDDGAGVDLAAGDVIVQRGTLHTWRNASTTETCRVAFVLIEARSYQVDDGPLTEIFPDIE